MRIRYVSYNYGQIGNKYNLKYLHLVRFTNGQGILVTSEQLKALRK